MTKFYAYSQCQKVLGTDGIERDNWTFTSGHDYSLIGRTIGPVFIALARMRHNYMVNRLTKLEDSLSKAVNEVVNEQELHQGEKLCPTCNGLGYVWAVAGKATKQCPDCSGSHYVKAG